MNEYIASERFIHDGLLRQAEAMVQHIYQTWTSSSGMPDLAFGWPSEEVKADDGASIDGIVSMPLPKEPDRRLQALNFLKERIKPYGLLLMETRGQRIEACFTTRHGQVRWEIPVEDHGDVKVLGEMRRTEVNREELS